MLATDASRPGTSPVPLVDPLPQVLRLLQARRHRVRVYVHGDTYVRVPCMDHPYPWRVCLYVHTHVEDMDGVGVRTCRIDRFADVCMYSCTYVCVHADRYSSGICTCKGSVEGCESVCLQGVTCVGLGTHLPRTERWNEWSSYDVKERNWGFEPQSGSCSFRLTHERVLMYISELVIKGSRVTYVPEYDP